MQLICRFTLMPTTMVEMRTIQQVFPVVTAGPKLLAVGLKRLTGYLVKTMTQLA